MTKVKPELNELTPVAGAIRTLKEVRECIISEKFSNNEIIEKIDSSIAIKRFGCGRSFKLLFEETMKKMFTHRSLVTTVSLIY